MSEQKLPLVERMAYVLSEWEESHRTVHGQQMINGRDRPEATVEDPDPEPYPVLYTECECQHCRDARVVLEDYEEAGGDARAARIRY